MRNEFVSLTFVRACTSFRERVELLPGHHPMTVNVGEKGCLAITRDPEGGFDVLGVENQHFWVAPANVVWGRKRVDTEPIASPAPLPVNTSTVSEPEKIADIMQEFTSKKAWVEEPKPPPTPPRPRGRPRKS